jgi:hypothetical protein
MCAAIATLPAGVQDEILDYMTEQAARVEAARASLREHQPRVLGAAKEAVEQVARRMPLTASTVGIGWLLMAIVNAWLSGLFTLGGGSHFIMGL